MGHFSEGQAQNILDLKLQRLTRLEKNQIFSELKELVAHSDELYKLLNDRKARLDLLKRELEATLHLIDGPRLTKIQNFEPKPGREMLIAKEDMLITVATSGYIKRSPLSDCHTQHRGGKGRAGVKNQEIPAHVFTANTLQEVLFFSKSGKAYSKKVYELPETSITGRGKSLLSMIPEDEISTILAIPEESADKHLVFATKNGKVRRNLLSDFANLRCDGKIAIKLSDEDQLIGVSLAQELNDLMIATRKGKLIRFRVKEIRIMNSRESSGVRGIELDPEDEVVSMHVTSDEVQLLSVSRKGYGKRTPSSMYRISHRGGKGVLTFDISEKTGDVAAVLPVFSDEDIILMTGQGQTIRIKSGQIRETGRCTQGVQLVKTEDVVMRVIATAKEERSDED